MSSGCGVVPPAARLSHVFRARGKRLSLGRRTALMGVINVTPDSFYAGSRFPHPDQAVAAGLEMVAQGANIVDVGGESTRPGASPVPPREELDRVIAVVAGLRKQTEALVSIDTRRAVVAVRALEAGADIVNDVTAFADPEMASVVAESGAGCVLMHMRGTPQTMQHHPRYDDVTAEVRAYLSRAVERAESAGVDPDAILVDPGIGFGKTVAHNLTLLNRLAELATIGKPVLVGTSRKTFVGKLLGKAPAERLLGTMATVTAAVLRGAHVVRVHDVSAARDITRVVDAILREVGEDEL